MLRYIGVEIGVCDINLDIARKFLKVPSNRGGEN